jgi:hypothetical protein
MFFSADRSFYHNNAVPVTIEAANGAGYTVTDGADLVTVLPGGHVALGSGNGAFTMDVGQNGALNISYGGPLAIDTGNHNVSITLTGSTSAITLTGTGAVTLIENLATSLTTSQLSGNLTVTGLLSYSNATNEFGGNVSLTATASDASFTNQHATTLGASSFSGNLTVTSAGSLVQSALTVVDHAAGYSATPVVDHTTVNILVHS